VTRTHVRDEGLRRISRLTGWVAALGVAGVGFLAAAVSHAAPGRSAATVSPAVQAGTGSGAEGATTGGDASAGAAVDPGSGASGFQAPAQAPVAVPQAPIVRSGAS